MTAPSPTVLLDLAERCERATGEDRELDGRIHFETHGLRQVYHEVEDFLGSEFAASHPKRYTDSIDAAMTLVPEGLHWVLKSSDPKAVARIGCWKTGEYRIVGADAATPALALCAAALRARSTDTVRK